MLNVGPLELMVLVVLALIVFGPAKLPELMASAGNAIREFQRASRELTEVFQETQQEFSSALDLDLDSTATTVTEPAAEPSANGHATTEVASTVPFTPEVPVTTAPAEYETAAAMVDPVDPYPEPARPAEPRLEESSLVTAGPSAPAEYETAAGLVDDTPPPFEVKLGPTEPVAGEPTIAEPVSVAKVRRPRRPRAASADEAAPVEPAPEIAPDLDAPPADATAGIAADAVPVAEPAIATAPEAANGARPSRRRTAQPRPAAEPAVAPVNESA
jgi:TatA/E family protein of Tat protein translocase